ncbi:MAG TPA: hypothetical protein VHB21_21035 [Minicystis sp.]|nr:hypothetical protein [Minicystis sp.]
MHMLRRFREKRIALAFVGAVAATLAAVLPLGASGFGLSYATTVWSAVAAMCLAGVLLTVTQEITDRIERRT